MAIVGPRIAASAALFLLLWALSLVLPSPWFVVLVGVALLVVPALSWVTFWFFARKAVLPDAPLTLKIRVQDALALALASTVGGILGFLSLARVLNVIPSTGPFFVVGIAFALLMIAAPAINWLVVWRPWRPE